MTAKGSLFDYFAEHVAAQRNGIAYLYGERAVSFGEIDAQAARCRGALRDCGITNGDRVALVMSDSPEMVMALLAIMGLGAIAVPCSTAVRPDELAYMIADPSPRCVIVSADQLDTFAAARPLLTQVPPVLVMGETVPAGWDDLRAMMRKAAPLAPVKIDPESTATILYTSGTTGYPKGAVHRHRDIPHIIESTGRGVYDIGPGDRIFSSARIFFSFGFSNSVSVPLGLGATCILTSARPTPKVIADIFARYRPTVFFSVPAIFRALLELHRSGHVLQTRGLKFSASGGEKLSPQIFREWKELTGTDILDVIGTTEVMYGFISNRRDHIKLGSSGLPITGYDVKLVDDAGAVIENAGRGNLFVRGASISPHYWNKPDKSAETLQDGWLRTGDIYVRDEDGFYFFEGRSDDLFKSAGMWVAPTEVEEVLCSHEAVIETAVVSVPDGEGGFASVANVVLRPGWSPNEATAKAIAGHAAAALPRYKRPERIRFIDQIPRTATGKVQRFKLREAIQVPLANPPGQRSDGRKSRHAAR